MKKTLSIFLAVVMTILTIPMTAITVSAETDGYYTYKISDGCATITDVDKSISGDVSIPDTLGGYPVTSIADDVFQGCTSLTSVTVPTSLTSVGSSAFYGCNNLKSVYITDLAAWCSIDFQNYLSNPLYYAGNLYLNGELLTYVVIPDGVKTVGENVFCNCTSVKRITIPEGVTYIGYRAFYGCTNLEVVEIHEGLTRIGDSAFYNCKSLASITIPDSVTTIEYNAFSDCTSLKNVYITDLAAWCNISFFGVDSNPLYNAGSLYLNGELLTDAVIPDSVTKIGNSAFIKCTSLTSVTIPASVRVLMTGHSMTVQTSRA